MLMILRTIFLIVVITTINFETNASTQTNKVSVKMENATIDEIIKSNKKSSDHLIEVIFDGTSYGTDPDKIKEIKGMLKSFNGYKLQNYEISVDYDENGYVNKVTIESK